MESRWGVDGRGRREREGGSGRGGKDEGIKLKLGKDVQEADKRAREKERKATRGKMYWMEGKVAVFKRSDEKGVNDAGRKEGEASSS